MSEQGDKLQKTEQYFELMIMKQREKSEIEFDAIEMINESNKKELEKCLRDNLGRVKSIIIF